MTDAPIFDSDAWRLTDQERQLTAQARELGETRFADRASRYDREAKFPIENYRDFHNDGSVSYTHLTLPKILLV